MFGALLQTGEFEPLVTALTGDEEEQMKNMLRRIDTVAKVTAPLPLVQILGQ